jgi:protein-S-isoprenylcysteine O-methyltransferase Ste14
LNSLRYFLAVILVVSLPPLFLYWLLIHPFVAFWRGKGIGATYSAVLTIVGITMVGLFSMRHSLLQVDFGTSYLLIALGMLCLAVSGLMRFALQKHLTIKTLVGFPEIAPERYPRKLITEGIYGHMRHPRYAQFFIALAGYALVANYLASYLVVALWFPGIYIIVLLEEKELRDHFGSAYDEYSRKVPRFMPKFGPLLKSRA